MWFIRCSLKVYLKVPLDAILTPTGLKEDKHNIINPLAWAHSKKLLITGPSPLPGNDCFFRVQPKVVLHYVPEHSIRQWFEPRGLHRSEYTATEFGYLRPQKHRPLQSSPILAGKQQASLAPLLLPLLQPFVITQPRWLVQRELLAGKRKQSIAVYLCGTKQPGLTLVKYSDFNGF